jgi:NADH dehydrogenase
MIFMKFNKTDLKSDLPHVVIIGGGFAGVAAALALKKHLRSCPVRITLIDKNSHHLFTPALYEVATSQEPQKNIAFPFSKIFKRHITFMQGEVEKIHPEKNILQIKDGEKVSYDYLILAAGSQPAYMRIPGLEEHSIALKTLNDAIEIKERIKSGYCENGKCNKKLNVIIGGGGFTGTELAAEILTYKNRLAKQNHLDQNCLTITVIQGSDKLLKEFDSHVSNLAKQRLSDTNVQLAFGGHIKEVTDKEVLTTNGNAYPYDLLIWTGGVEANSLATKSGFAVNRRGQIPVGRTLQVEGLPNIFVAGDIAEFVDSKTQKPVPTVAQVAEEEGHIAGTNVIHAIRKMPLEFYHFRHFGYVVPIKGYFAVAELPYGIHFHGFLGWIVQQVVLLRYLFGILPPHRAFRYFNTFELQMRK